MASQDILLDPKTYGFLIKDGDFVIGNSEQQEANLILNTFENNWFEYPACGVGIINYLMGNISATVIEQRIKLQLEADGFIVDSISINGTTLENVKVQILAHK